MSNDSTEAQREWVCQTVDAARRYYRAEDGWAERHNRANTDHPAHAKRYPTQEAADKARPICDATGGEPIGFHDCDEHRGGGCPLDGRLVCLPPNQWEAAPAPDVPPAPHGSCLLDRCFCS